jgi:hypothetical protein
LLNPPQCSKEMFCQIHKDLLLVVHEKCREFLNEGFLLLYLGYVNNWMFIRLINEIFASKMENGPNSSISDVVGYLTYVNNSIVYLAKVAIFPR